MRGGLLCRCALYGGMTIVKPYNPILRFMAVYILLGTAGVQAADGHQGTPKKHAPEKHMGVTPRVDSHKPSGKPMALTPADIARAAVRKEKAAAAKKTASPKPMTLRKPAAAKPAKSTKSNEPAKKVAMSSHARKKAHVPHWGYHGAGGPAHWGDLKSTFKTCSAGHRQSPINLEATEAAHLIPLSIHYKVSPLDLVNNGHTVQANYSKGSYITLGTERYDLLQFHFHTPSEHRVADRSFPMEIHFVHRNKRGQLAVLGVLVAPGDYNLAAREIWDRLPTRAHTKSAKSRSLINARDLLPGDTRHFRYSGSLTTPPCSENVNWLVLQTPVKFSEGQIAKLHRIIGMNARPAQARNSRYLLQSIGG